MSKIVNLWMKIKGVTNGCLNNEDWNLSTIQGLQFESFFLEIYR